MLPLISNNTVADTLVEQEMELLDVRNHQVNTPDHLQMFPFTGTATYNGISYLVKFTLEDGDQSYRAITFDLGSGLKLSIGYDPVYGIETVKAISPYVNNRRAHITGAHIEVQQRLVSY